MFSNSTQNIMKCDFGGVICLHFMFSYEQFYTSDKVFWTCVHFLPSVKEIKDQLNAKICI